MWFSDSKDPEEAALSKTLAQLGRLGLERVGVTSSQNVLPPGALLRFLTPGLRSLGLAGPWLQHQDVSDLVRTLTVKCPYLEYLEIFFPAGPLQFFSLSDLERLLRLSYLQTLSLKGVCIDLNYAAPSQKYCTSSSLRVLQLDRTEFVPEAWFFFWKKLDCVQPSLPGVWINGRFVQNPEA